MKCPECKVDNPDGKNYCGNCGKRLSKEPSKFRIQLREATPLIVLLTVILVLLGYVANPLVSPLSSVHDADGDGVADSVDKAWLDSEKWASATGKIIVSITNYDDDHNLSYSIWLDGIVMVSGSITPEKTAVRTLTLDWSYGENPIRTCAVVVTYSSADSYERSMLPVDGKTIEIGPDEVTLLGVYY